MPTERKEERRDEKKKRGKERKGNEMKGQGTAETSLFSWGLVR